MKVKYLGDLNFKVGDVLLWECAYAEYKEEYTVVEILDEVVTLEYLPESYKFNWKFDQGYEDEYWSVKNEA